MLSLSCGCRNDRPTKHSLWLGAATIVVELRATVANREAEADLLEGYCRGDSKQLRLDPVFTIKTIDVASGLKPFVSLDKSATSRLS
jgi:hypothetical protein